MRSPQIGSLVWVIMGFGEQWVQEEIYILPPNYQNLGKLFTISDPAYHINGDNTYSKLLD